MIDTHAHLTDERFTGDLEGVVARGREAGLEAIVTVGTDPDDSLAAVEIARGSNLVLAAVGIHPHAASAATEEAVARIRDLAAEPRVVAIGETGLDYHYDFSPRPVQRAAFARQLRLAADLRLPVLVHAREADEDLAAMLREFGGAVRGVLHSFSSGAALLGTALELGWYASFAGMVTFRNHQGAELVRSVPGDRLLVETDSPYLTPVPHRGKRNEPAHVILVASRLAELRGEGAAALAASTTANARRFYALDGAHG